MKYYKISSIIALVACSIFPSNLMAQQYQATINTREMNSAKTVSSLNFAKDGLNFQFSLGKIFYDNQAYANTIYSFTTDDQVSCMEQTVLAAKKALTNPDHRAFMKTMKVDHVNINLVDSTGFTVAPSIVYGPSIVDDPYFILRAVINKSGTCMTADSKQLSDQFYAWEKSYAKTGNLSAMSKDLAEEITNVNHVADKGGDDDGRAITSEHRGKHSKHHGDAGGDDSGSSSGRSPK